MKKTHDIVIDWIARLPTWGGTAAICADTELIDAGILDSLAILNLVGFLEERFNITIPIEEFVPENFRTPAAIMALAIRLSEKAA
jgi:acyl carrier protein